MIQHYVEFLYPGAFFAESSVQKTETRDPNSLVLPDGADGFRFFSRTEFNVDGEVVMGEKKDFSEWFYIGREMSLDNVKREMSNERILQDNMKYNHWDRIVCVRSGKCYPLESGDRVIQR